MADYNALKVPDLRKLLTERNLPSAGNKPDLLKRLMDDDEAKGEDGGTGQAGEFCSSFFLSDCPGLGCLPCGT
jgi:hypothetical protein